MYNKFCTWLFEYNPLELKKAISIRKEKARRKATINEALRIIDFPIELIKKQNVWQFIVKEGVEENKSKYNN